MSILELQDRFQRCYAPVFLLSLCISNENQYSTCEILLDLQSDYNYCRCIDKDGACEKYNWTKKEQTNEGSDTRNRSIRVEQV